LTVATHATTTADRGSSNSPTMSLAGLAVFGLLPLGLWRRRMFCAYLSLPLILGMVGCGYTPSSTIAVANTTTSAYHVLITATSSARKTTFSIPLEVQ
jgi:LPXTG-motif cell wall-anchored protein